MIIGKTKAFIGNLEDRFDKLRERIPGLPSNRAIFSAVVLSVVILFLLVVFQRLLGPKEKFSTYTLPYEQYFDDVNLRNWFPGAGVWTIRDAALSQTIGGDTPAQLFIPYKLIDDTPYHASVYITLKKDTRMAGISFNAQYPNLMTKQQRVYISRSDTKALELVSGYLDDTGSFIPQVQVPLSIDTTDYRMDLYVYSNTYIVQLNGQRLIQDRPLFYKNGLIGFYTLGPAIFDTYKLTTAENQDPGNLVYNSDFDKEPGGAGWVPFSGTWKITGKKLEQSDAIKVNAGIGYETSSFQNYTLRVTLNHLQGQGAGVLFNMPSPYQLNGSQVVRYSDETDSLIWGSFDEQGGFIRQGFVGVSQVGREDHVIQVYSGDTSYDVFLDDQIIARDVPLVSKQGNIGLISSSTIADFSTVEVYPLFGTGGGSLRQLTPVAGNGTPVSNPSSSGNNAAIGKLTGEPSTIPTDSNSNFLKIVTPTTSRKVTSVPAINGNPSATLAATEPSKNLTAIPAGTQNSGSNAGALVGGQSPYHGIFTGKLSDQNWFAVNGQWKFQNGSMVQSQTNGFDLTAIYTKTKYKNYSFQVGLTHQQGSGGGLLFNLQKPDGLSGASMVRYSDKRDNALIWGYFDDNGVYKNLGYAEVNHAGTDHHTLRVTSGDSSFSVYLDDRLIVQSVPFGTRQNNGYIGLLTSVSSVIYDEVTVDGVGAAFKGNFTSLDGFTDQRVVSGKWTITNNKITQTVPDAADYVWNTGVQASQYSVSAKITLPKGSTTSGAGFILNMPERGSKNNSFIARLIKGGQGFWWGVTDDAGKFKGQGSINIDNSTNPVVLKIVIDTGQMSIFINDAQIASNIKMSGVDGWIGLVSYGGPVIFEDVKLDVTQ